MLGKFHFVSTFVAASTGKELLDLLIREKAKKWTRCVLVSLGEQISNCSFVVRKFNNLHKLIQTE